MVQSHNICVDKWFNQTRCSSKLENNTKKTLNIPRQSRDMTQKPQLQSPFEYSTQMMPTKRHICFCHQVKW